MKEKILAVLVAILMVATVFGPNRVNAENQEEESTMGSESSAQDDGPYPDSENSSEYPEPITNSSGNNNNTNGTYIIHVAIYNVSELESDGYNDTIGSENWSYTGTCGMARAMDGYVFIKNGKTYKFVTHILEANEIGSGKLTNGDYDYKILLAPGDDDYWWDGSAARNGIKNFVESGRGYIGTCGGAGIACRHYWHAEDATPIGGPGICLNLVNADAWNTYPNTGNHAYFDRHTMFDEDDCGVGDWGGIPMENKFTDDPPAPFEGYNEKTLRYWGGPWFDNLGTGVTGVAKYNKEPGNETTTQLHKLNGNVVETNIQGKWSILIQEAIDGKGRIVLFGCHPEHYTWEWGSGQVVENNSLTKQEYIYCYPSPQPDEEPDPAIMSSPPYPTDSVIQDCAKWIVEPILDDIDEFVPENNEGYENPDPPTNHDDFP